MTAMTNEYLIYSFSTPELTTKINKLGRLNNPTIVVALGHLKCVEEVPDEWWLPLKVHQQSLVKRTSPVNTYIVPREEPIETTTSSLDLLTSREQEP